MLLINNRFQLTNWSRPQDQSARYTESESDFSLDKTAVQNRTPGWAGMLSLLRIRFPDARLSASRPNRDRDSTVMETGTGR
jgi:hypothetical protein